MKWTFKWFIRTLVTFVVICALSYHNDTDVDGDLHFGFPKKIYSKSVHVLLSATGEIGGTENFHVTNLLIDIAFAFIIMLILFSAYKKIFGRKKDKA